jgi:hypothetical protein
MLAEMCSGKGVTLGRGSVRAAYGSTEETDVARRNYYRSSVSLVRLALAGLP